MPKTPHNSGVSTTTRQPLGEHLTEALKGRPGQWVAIKEEELLVAAPTPKEVLAWLARHGQRADSMFRVPEDEAAATGIAPL